MSLKGEYFPDNVDEEARRRFERALAAGSSVLIDDYLPDIADHKYLATLEELVSISLEYSWQHWTAETPGPAPQPLEYFLSRFPVLAESGIQKRLRELEQSVRRETRRTATHTTSCTVSESSGSPVSRSLPASGQGESSTDPAAHPRQFRFQDQFRSLMPHYEILEKISGRAETTYRGYDWSRHREVKLSHIASPRGDVVKSLKTLCAPFIKPMDESVVFPDGSSVLVMEQIQGRGLQQRMLENGGTIAEATALKWMKQICEGMTYVAARKIVHRNLKPANIVIDETETAYVDDFRLAAFSGSTDGPAGTPVYMSRESLQRTPPIVELQDDIYSFGATFYHALTGKVPGSWSLDKSICPAESLIPVQQLAPHISAATSRLLERCLSTQPKERFHSFVEVLTQLENPARSIRLDGPPPDLHGYHLLSCLGEGGMGVVYKARDLASDRCVALKFIRSPGRNNPEFLARFRIEAEAIACLRHPNIVPVLDIRAFGGYPYLALEYVDGGSLYSRIGEFRADPVRSAEVIARVALGVHHAHRLGILHRDLKPHNILLSPDGVPRITDFGLARFMLSARERTRLRQDSILPGIQGSLSELDRFIEDGISEHRIAESVRTAMDECDPEFAETVSMDAVQRFVEDTVRQGRSEDVRFLKESPTQSGDLLGTPAYMAPEQTIGDQDALGPATDIYALGIVLYQMVSGRLPFQGSSPSELFRKIQSSVPPPLGRDVPFVLSEICFRCLSRQPGDRYQNAHELFEDLQRFVTDRGLQTRTGKKWWQWWRAGR